MSSYSIVVLASGATIRRDPQTKKIIFSDDAQEAGEYDEVGDWRKYASKDDDLYIVRIARGCYSCIEVENAFDWAHTPQGFDFWDRIALENATPAEEARARNFARRVLEAMEADDAAK